MEPNSPGPAPISEPASENTRISEQKRHLTPTICVYLRNLRSTSLLPADGGTQSTKGPTDKGLRVVEGETIINSLTERSANQYRLQTVQGIP